MHTICWFFCIDMLKLHCFGNSDMFLAWFFLDFNEIFCAAEHLQLLVCIQKVKVHPHSNSFNLQFHSKCGQSYESSPFAFLLTFTFGFLHVQIISYFFLSLHNFTSDIFMLHKRFCEILLMNRSVLVLIFCTCFDMFLQTWGLSVFLC